MARGASVTLSGQSEKFVNEQVDSGRFGSAGDVVQEGLRMLEAHQRQMDWLRAQIAIGEAQYRAGNVHEVNDEFWEKLDREVDEALMRGDQPSPHACP
jgi:antitoxin ParD1/3/4